MGADEVTQEKIMRKPQLAATIIILTKNGERYLDEVLTHVVAQKTDYPYEVIAIDSGSTDATLAILARHPVRVERIAAEQFNHGETRNLGARLARGKFVVYLTQDATPANDRWLHHLVEPLEHNPALCAVFSRHRPRPGCQPVLACHLERVSPLGATEPKVKHLPAGGTTVDLPSYISLSNTSACYVRDLLLQFPFKAVTFAEDAQWELAMLRKGYATLFQPQSMVHHCHDFSLLEQLRQSFDRGRAWEIMFRTHCLAGRCQNNSTRKKILTTLRSNWVYLTKHNGMHLIPRVLWFGYSILWDGATMIGQRLGAQHRHIPYPLQAWLSRQARLMERP